MTDSSKDLLLSSALRLEKKVRELEAQLAELREQEPVAYMTYKGYLLHAGDPKVSEYSDPIPLYANPPLLE